MADSQEVVNPEGSTTPAAPTPVVTEQPEVPTQSGSEPVQTPEAPTEGKNYQELYENAKKARDDERRRRKEAEEALRNNPQPAQEPVEDDEQAVQMFWDTKSKTDLLTMANSDPFVRDNFADISEELSKNPMGGAEVAAMRVKASIMDKIFATSEVIQRSQSPQSLTPSPTPEEQPQEDEMDSDLKAILEEKLGN